MALYVPNRRNVLSLLGVAAFSKLSLAATNVDLALVLAVDCSYSIGEYHYHLQMRGLGQAFLDSEMLDLVSHGLRGKIAIAAFLWSDPVGQQLVVPWRVLEKAGDAIDIGTTLLTAPRLLNAGSTSTGAALLYAAELLQQAPSGSRRVVDVSSNGHCNFGEPIRNARDKVVGQSITINGLAIDDEQKNMFDYMQANMIGGDGAFVVTANDFNDYTRAIRSKLFKEIAGASLA